MRIQLQELEDGNIVEGNLVSIKIGTDGLWYNLDDCAPPFTLMTCSGTSYKILSITEPALLTMAEHKDGIGVEGVLGHIGQASKQLGIMVKTRETSLAATNLEQAELWLLRSQKKM